MSYAPFGYEYFSVTESVPLVTTSAAFISYKTLSPTVSGGDYKFSWHYVWSHNAANNDFVGQIILDGGSDVMNISNDGDGHRQEPKDAGGGGTGGTNQRYHCSGITFLTLPPGVRTFDLQFRSDPAGVNSTIYAAEMDLVRVSA